MKIHGFLSHMVKKNAENSAEKVSGNSNQNRWFLIIIGLLVFGVFEMFYELSKVQVLAVLSSKTAAPMLVTNIRDKMCW